MKAPADRQVLIVLKAGVSSEISWMIDGHVRSVTANGGYFVFYWEVLGVVVGQGL